MAKWLVLEVRFEVEVEGVNQNTVISFVCQKGRGWLTKDIQDPRESAFDCLLAKFWSVGWYLLGGHHFTREKHGVHT